MKALAATLCAAVVVCSASAFAAEPIVLTVDEPALAGAKAVPVTTGIPLAKGALKSLDTVRVLDAAGKPVTAQVGTLSKWWNDGSVRAIVLDFQTDLDAKGHAQVSVELDSKGAAPATAAKGFEAGDGASVHFGPVEFSVSKKGEAAAWFDANGDGKYTDDERVVLDGGASGPWLKSGDGKTFREVADGRVVTLEESGPMRATVKVTALLKADGDERTFACTTRYTLYSGQPFVRVQTTFRYLMAPYDVNKKRETRIAEEQKTDVVWTGWGWDMISALGAADRFCADIDGKVVSGAAPGGSIALAQSLVDAASAGETKGKLAAGWIAVSGKTASLGVGIRDAALLFPKAVRVTPEKTSVILWEPPEGAPELKIRGGFASRVNEFVLTFAKTPEDAGKLAASTLSPVRAFATPDTYCSAGYVNTLPRRPGKYEAFEKVVDRWLARAMKDTPMRGEMDFGDTAGWSLPPWKHICYGMIHDLGHPFTVAFFRTGDRKYFYFLDAFARHVRIDNTIREMAKQGGITSSLPWSCNNWHIAYFEDGPTQALLKKGDMMSDSCPPASGGCVGLPRINATGAFDHYLLTGDRFSLEAAMDLSAYALVIHRIGALPAHHADNGRAFRNFVNMLASRYRVTGDEESKAALLKFFADCKRTHFLEKEKRWAFGAWGEPPSKNQPFAWAVAMESPGLIRGLNNFIEDTGSPEAKEFLVDLMQQYWDMFEKYTPDLVKALNEGDTSNKQIHRWTEIAAALGHAYIYTGDKAWLDRAVKAWAMSCADSKAADSVTFYYGMKLDNWGYDMYAEYCPEFLPIIEKAEGGK